MSREIKFRAWFNRENKMVPTDRLEYQYSKEDGAYVAFDCDSLDENGNYIKGSYSFELMQYTGLKDRKGREVWEGDILQAFYGKDNKPWAKTRVYFNKKGYWDSESASGNEKVCYAGFFKCEVIGNIYENPSLMKEGEAE